MKEKLKQTNGITLIALIITIIILLILAMVSIRLIINQGIIGKAEKGVSEYSRAEDDEQFKLLKAEIEMEKYPGVKTEITEEEATAAGWKWNSGAITGYTGTETELYFPSKIGSNEITSTFSTFNVTNKTEITKIVVPGSIKTFNAQLGLYGLTNLEIAILKEGVEKLDAGYTFYNCSNLKYVILPSTLTKIR